jgi:hypothetical protein
MSSVSTLLATASTNAPSFALPPTFLNEHYFFSLRRSGNRTHPLGIMVEAKNYLARELLSIGTYVQLAAMQML